MTTTIFYQCACGKDYLAYIPKQVVFGELLGDTSIAWKELDNQEDSASFIDYRETPILICSCKALLDIKSDMAARMMQSKVWGIPYDENSGEPDPGSMSIDLTSVESMVTV